MSWKDGFSAAVLEFLRTELGKDDAIEVTGFESGREDRGGPCDTCAYTTAVVRIGYRTGKDSWSREATWDGDFSELISRLTDSA